MRSNMLTQLARINPTLPNIWVRIQEAAKNRIEKSSIILLYLQGKIETVKYKINSDLTEEDE